LLFGLFISAKEKMFYNFDPQTSLYKLRVVSEILHARHTSGGWFSRPLPNFTLEP
jgi:hypothetical protein